MATATKANNGHTTNRITDRASAGESVHPATVRVHREIVLMIRAVRREAQRLAEADRKLIGEDLIDAAQLMVGTLAIAERLFPEFDAAEALARAELNDGSLSAAAIVCAIAEELCGLIREISREGDFERIAIAAAIDSARQSIEDAATSFSTRGVREEMAGWLRSCV